MRLSLQQPPMSMSMSMSMYVLQVLLVPYADGPLLADLLRSSVLLLAHKYPKVRKAAADQLYLHLLTYGDPGQLCAPPLAAPPPLPPTDLADACGN